MVLWLLVHPNLCPPSSENGVNLRTCASQFHPQPLSAHWNPIRKGAPRHVRVVPDVKVALSSEPSTFGSAYRPAGPVADAKNTGWLWFLRKQTRTNIVPNNNQNTCKEIVCFPQEIFINTSTLNPNLLINQFAMWRLIKLWMVLISKGWNEQHWVIERSLRDWIFLFPSPLWSLFRWQIQESSTFRSENRPLPPKQYQAVLKWAPKQWIQQDPPIHSEGFNIGLHIGLQMSPDSPNVLLWCRKLQVLFVQKTLEKTWFSCPSTRLPGCRKARLRATHMCARCWCRPVGPTARESRGPSTFGPGNLWRGWQLWNSCRAACCSFKGVSVEWSPTTRDF